MSKLSVSEREELDELRRQRDLVRAYIVEEMGSAAHRVVDYAKNTPKLDRLIGLYAEFRDAKSDEVKAYLGERLVETAAMPTDFADSVEQMSRLLGMGADPNFVHHAKTPLLNACRNANLKGVKLILSWKADPSLSPEGGDGEAPLHVVSDTRVPEIAAELVLAGADLWARDARGRSALERSELANNKAVASIFRSGEARQFAELAVDELSQGARP